MAVCSSEAAHSLLTTRHRECGALLCCMAGYLIVLCAAAARLSLLHPLRLCAELIGQLLSVWFWVGVVLCSSLYTAACLLLPVSPVKYIAVRSCESRLVRVCYDASVLLWLAAVYCVTATFVVRAAELSPDTYECAFLVLCSAVALVYAFWTRARQLANLSFYAPRLGMRSLLRTYCGQLGPGSFLGDCCTRAVVITAAMLPVWSILSFAYHVVFAASFSGWLPSVLLLRVLWPTAVLCALAIALVSLLTPVTAACTLKPIEFALPPPSLVPSRTDAYLPDFLHSPADRVLQYFAFLDLYTLCTSLDTGRRAQLFALSQPGQHPRNWQAVSICCRHQITRQTNQLLQANQTLHVRQATAAGGGLSAGVNGSLTYNDSALGTTDVVDRLLQPPEYGRPAVERKPVGPDNNGGSSCAGRWPVSLRDACGRALRSLLATAPLPSRQQQQLCPHLQLTLWSAQALSLLCERSVTEDTYGCVQRDMAAILGEMLALYRQAHAHEKLAAATGTETASADVRVLKLCVSECIQRCVHAYGLVGLRSINLDADHKHLLRVWQFADL